MLPATTQLEHWDVHYSYGHHYVTLNRPSIEPVGECKPNSEIFRLLAARMGLNPVAHIKGGFGEWKKSGAPVEEPESKKA